jgi:hypothetical protein
LRAGRIAHGLADPLGDLAAQELAGRGVGELHFRPDEDAANLLEGGEFLVGVLDGLLQLRFTRRKEDDGDGLRAAGFRRGRRRTRGCRAVF